MIVVKIGGCNGSGKTSVVRALLGMYECAPIMDFSRRAPRPEAYLSVYGYKGFGEHRLAVLGSYENVCGGMDTISDKEDRLALLKKYSADDTNIVVYEGLITGKTYGAMGELSETPEHFGRWLYVFMDTPFETCVERVLTRRQAAGNDAPFDPERTMRPTYKSCISTRERAAARGHQTLLLDHTKGPPTLATHVIKAVTKLMGQVKP